MALRIEVIAFSNFTCLASAYNRGESLFGFINVTAVIENDVGAAWWWFSPWFCSLQHRRHIVRTLCLNAEPLTQYRAKLTA